MTTVTNMSEWRNGIDLGINGEESIESDWVLLPGSRVGKSTSCEQFWLRVEE